jgi:uncharacterized protein (DUF1684 family)
MSTNEAEFDESAWRAELERHRERKDDFFATERQSPIPADQRDAFDGLSYFEPDPDYRVEASLDPVESDETVVMDTTVDTEQEYERVAELRFELDGEPLSLVGYTGVGEESDSLFVPFRDKTTGQQTYGAGRYMEFEVDGNVADADTVTLDFNLAYHPFCAYNEAFACPLPPEENWLDVAIEAGEKLPDA